MTPELRHFGLDVPRAVTLLMSTPIDANGCWTWQRSTTGGYGRIKFNGRLDLTHRVAYLLWVGDLIRGMQIDHLCRNRGCCNPAHLEQVTPLVNQQRACPRRTECGRGHPFNETNTGFLHGRRVRYCRTCKLARDRASKARRWVPIATGVPA